MALSASVVIATRNRPQALAATLRTLLGQSQPPLEALIVDSSEDQDTATVASIHEEKACFPIHYIRASTASAAGQRNDGVQFAKGQIVVFIDDDVDLDPEFLREILVPFEDDRDQQIAGVSGLITNQCYTTPSTLNALLLGLVMGDHSRNWAGRIVGPAVNFLPADIPGTVQQVEWLNTTGTAYRRSVLIQFPFGSHFRGYSFAEDLDLSARVGRSYRLLNTTKARFFHHDMGQSTHKNWVEIGFSSVLNRYRILTQVLNRRSLGVRIRFFLFEMAYGGLTALTSSRLRPARLRQLGLLLLGKAKAFWTIWAGAAEHTIG